MTAATTPDSLATLLAKYEVKRALVIDDLFDLTVAEFIKDDSWDQFKATVDSDKAVRDELATKHIDSAAVLRREQTVLRELATRRDDLIAARPAVEALLLDYLAELGSVDELTQHLKLLKIDVTTLGATDEIPADLASQLAFIDYYLDGDPPQRDPKQENLESVAEVRRRLGQRARQKARKVYEVTRAHIILMSNQPDVAASEADFQQEAKLLKGYFRFEAKQSLSDLNMLQSLLGMLPLSADFRHALHDFIDCLDVRAKALVNIFMDEIRRLGLEDYAHLRQLSLNRDGHPFGDYTIKLFGAFLTSLVLEDQALATQVASLDQTKFESLLPIVSEPSNTLGRIYLASLTERLRKPIEGAAVQPAEPVQSVDARPTTIESDGHSAPAADALPPHTKVVKPLIPLELGDLFVRDIPSPVYAVMNPACDLPVGHGRMREGDDTVLLLPGLLRLLHEPPVGERGPTFFTPIYLHDGHLYRIDWDYRKLRALPHRSLPRLLARGYRCERRLHLGPALELQQHFTAETGRVGLPVPAPIGRSATITVYCRGKTGAWHALTPNIAGGARVYHMRDRDEFVIPDPTRKRVIELVAAHAVSLKGAPPADWEGVGSCAHYKSALEGAAKRWETACPFHRKFGTMPSGRINKKQWSEKQSVIEDKLAVVIGTSFLTETLAKTDVVLSLSLGPMPLADGTGTPHEMDELQ